MRPLFAAALALSGLAICAGAPARAVENPSVSAKNGPIKLTLTLSSSKIKVGDPIWFRVGVTNVSDTPLRIFNCLVASDIVDFAKELTSNTRAKRRIYLVVQDPDGQVISDHFPHGPIDGCPEPGDAEPGSADNHFTEVHEPPEVQRKVQQKVDGWAKQGLSQAQIQARLDKEYEQNNLKSATPPNCSGIDLQPHRTVESSTWVFKGFCPDDRMIPPKPPGRFAELYQVQIEKPGRYRVFAIYDETPLHDPFIEKFDREHGYKPRKRDPTDVRVQTPAIQAEVGP